MTSNDGNPPRPPCAHAQFDVGTTDDSLEQMTQFGAEFGDIYRVYAPGRGRDTWVVADPETIKRVLVSNHRSYTVGAGLDRVRVLVGDGIIVSEGETWKRQHRMMQPMFQRSRVEQFGELIVDATRRRLAGWADKAERGAELNITRETSESALEVVLRATLGTDLDRLCADLGSNPFALLTEESARDLRFAFRFRQLGRHVDDMITRRESGASSAGEGDWLGMMMAARDRGDGSAMSHRELIDEVMSIIVAGHETTAAVLNSVWYLLSQHPQVEAKLHVEVDAVELSDWRLSSVESLRYTHQIIMEALRLYPPVWVLTRRCVHADRLLGFEAPADTDVFMSPYVVQRDPRHWPDPDQFRPERFEDGNQSAPHRFAYIPFSAGPRHCVGETFATYEMAIHLYLAARRLRLRCVQSGPRQMEARINLRMREDLMMRLEARA
ncbi:MAG TPA: cytochrome P450 [Steroidobacteraceae bacterium]|jgi:cytochrome P450